MTSYSSSRSGPHLYVMAGRADRGAAKATSPAVTWGPRYQPPAPWPARGPHCGTALCGLCQRPGWQPRRGRAGGPPGRHCLWHVGRSRQILTAGVTHGQRHWGFSAHGVNGSKYNSCPRCGFQRRQENSSSLRTCPFCLLQSRLPTKPSHGSPENKYSYSFQQSVSSSLF